MRLPQPSYPSILLCMMLLAIPGHGQQRQRDTLLLHFELDKAAVRPEDSIRVHDFVFRPGPRHMQVDSIYFFGYTDKTGTPTHNRKLSQIRADSAMMGVMTQYVWAEVFSKPPPYLFPPPDTSHWKRVGLGVAPTPELSDSANRRVEVIFVGTIVQAPDSAVALHPNRTDSASSGSATAPGPDSAARDSTQPMVIRLRNINFVVDTPIPTDATRMILPGYVKQLRQYKDRRMEIDGYVNFLGAIRGPKDPMYILSVQRAKFVYDYLISAGFDSTRLTYKGMGNSSPVNANPTTKEEMDANMRVEIKVY